VEYYWRRGLVKSHQEVPAEVIALGCPVSIFGPISMKHKEKWMKAKKTYIDFTMRNRQGLGKYLSIQAEHRIREKNALRKLLILCQIPSIDLEVKK
jgi:hypothetical protein